MLWLISQADTSILKPPHGLWTSTGPHGGPAVSPQPRRPRHSPACELERRLARAKAINRKSMEIKRAPSAAVHNSLPQTAFPALQGNEPRRRKALEASRGREPSRCPACARAARRRDAGHRSLPRLRRPRERSGEMNIPLLPSAAFKRAGKKERKGGGGGRNFPGNIQQENKIMRKQ